MKFDKWSQDQAWELRSSLAPCSLLPARIQGSEAVGSSSHQLFDSSVVERSAAEAAAYKSGRGFPQETLRAVRVAPRMVFEE